jgi:hypothetical protein
MKERSSEISVNYQSTWRQTPDDSILQSPTWEPQISHTLVFNTQLKETSLRGTIFVIMLLRFYLWLADLSTTDIIKADDLPYTNAKL